MMDTDALLDAFEHHIPNVDQQSRIQQNRQAFKAVARVLLSTTRPGHDRDVAMLHLRKSMFFANASVALEAS